MIRGLLLAVRVAYQHREDTLHPVWDIHEPSAAGRHIRHGQVLAGGHAELAMRSEPSVTLVKALRLLADADVGEHAAGSMLPDTPPDDPKAGPVVVHLDGEHIGQHKDQALVLGQERCRSENSTSAGRDTRCPRTANSPHCTLYTRRVRKRTAMLPNMRATFRRRIRDRMTELETT
jgi:hypothetical protein